MDFLHIAQTTLQTDAEAGGSAGGLILWLILWIATIVSFWKVFEKAHQPGWAAVIPIYNLFVLLKIAGRPGWWLVLYLIPFVNVVVHLVVSLDVAKAFGKSPVFGVFGLWLFSLIGFLILGFGSATYRGTAQPTQPLQPSM